MSCAKTAEPIDFLFGWWTKWVKDAQVQSYSPGGANVPSNVGTLAPLAEYHCLAGSIARSARRRYLIYSEADFEVFRPEGETRCTDKGEGPHN